MLSLTLILFFLLSPFLSQAQKSCGSGYRLGKVTNSASGFVAELQLLEPPQCSSNYAEIKELKLTVEYQTDTRLHVLIEDAAHQVYQVQEDILPRPPAGGSTVDASLLRFEFTTNDHFGFKITRKPTGEVLFDTSHSGSAYSGPTEPTLIFQPQYVRLRTSLPKDANIYGLGEHSDSFRLASKYTRTLWNSENPFIPRNQNLYGSHPIYFDHRGSSGTHGVFLLNANGMDVKLDQTANGTQYLEYNTLGGVLDFYFLAGPEPAAVTQQYTEVVGLPAMMPYWTFGFHQCKFGWDSLDVLNGVVANYSEAKIPLEGIWADINYMDGHKDFTADPGKFPLSKFQGLTSDLHAKNQHLVAILDPGIKPEQGYATFMRGSSQDVFLKTADGKGYYTGNQWPGQVVWPDWFHPNATNWWTEEIKLFFDPQTGLNISALWNDMNEASNMCSMSDLDSSCDSKVSPAWSGPNAGPKKGLPGRNLFHPPFYKIGNHWGDISSNTLFTNVSNHDGTYQYDTHNLYGTMMATASYNALLARSPNKKPFVLTRSNFPGSGKHSAHWFGDNASTWDDYRITIRQMLAYVSMHAIPMVGADVCGFNFDAQEKMCARWALMAAFQPFYRNHADQSAPPQEFYRWEVVASAARKGIDARYRLLDYIYTGMRRQTLNGQDTVPLVQPLFFVWPGDNATWGIETQWVLGGGILVSPVVDDDSTSVKYYLPPGDGEMRYYDFWTGKQVDGEFGWRTETNVSFTDMPVHFIGGNIVPMRVESAMSTAEVRAKNFTIVVAPDAEGVATGWLHLDDGVSLDVGKDFSNIELSWDGESRVLEAKGTFGFKTDVVVESVTVLGLGADGGSVTKTGSWQLWAGFKVRFE
ncbi:putative alpha/beta-glucosidase agdC [Rhypophila decipiens]|uniref:alpha-glucosidase n=1 Tax=Rhypophila decipiens TaxID=261697 RepID=A0AAN6Y9J5_9PEZI|nr:putative alpha/beta-glucosidase agdC [Rhypophila decipiens]